MPTELFTSDEEQEQFEEELLNISTELLNTLVTDLPKGGDAMMGYVTASIGRALYMFDYMEVRSATGARNFIEHVEHLSLKIATYLNTLIPRTLFDARNRGIEVPQQRSCIETLILWANATFAAEKGISIVDLYDRHADEDFLSKYGNAVMAFHRATNADMNRRLRELDGHHRPFLVEFYGQTVFLLSYGGMGLKEDTNIDITRVVLAMADYFHRELSHAAGISL